MKKTISLFILFSVSILGIICAVTGIIEPLENEIASFINPNSANNVLFRFFSWLGEAMQIIAILAVLLLLPSRERVGLPVAVTLLVSWDLNEIIKLIIKRQRPAQRLLEVGGYSFPSGHAMNAAALYIAVMLALLKIYKKPWQKAVIICILSIIPFMIGLSRIYFNVHYTTDVITGWCLGAIAAIIFDAVFENIRKKKAKITK